MAIEFKNVLKSFGTKKVLNGISFSIKKGEILFILGKSGTGKSVTLKNIVGLLKPDSGEILVDDMEVSRKTETEMEDVRKICGMVFQHPALLDSLTIYDNVAFGLRAPGSKWNEKQIKQRVQECLTLVHLNDKILKRKPPEISYGMQKRVSLARTLAPGPRFLLFDEPTTGLDPITTTAINDLIFELSRKLKVTSVVVSHDMGCALNVADRILVLDSGRILAFGSVDEIKNSKNELIRDFLSEVLSVR